MMRGLQGSAQLPQVPGRGLSAEGTALGQERAWSMRWEGTFEVFLRFWVKVIQSSGPECDLFTVFIIIYPVTANLFRHVFRLYCVVSRE